MVTGLEITFLFLNLSQSALDIALVSVIGWEGWENEVGLIRMEGFWWLENWKFRLL